MNALATVQVDDFLSWGVRKADHSDIQYVITYILVQDSSYRIRGNYSKLGSRQLSRNLQTYKYMCVIVRV